MLAAPLCGSRLRPHPQVGHRIASSRTSSPSSFSASRPSTQDKSRNEGMVMKYACRDEKLLNYTPQKSSSKLAGYDPMLNVENDDESLDLMELRRDSDLPSEITLTTGGHRLHYFQHDVAPCFVVCNWLKLAVLSALLALQDSQHAVALAETSIDVHLIDFIGDLGDVSTGDLGSWNIIYNLQILGSNISFVAFLLIFFSELGDKTFFIAALLSAQNSGTVVFFGTFGALAAMTIISVILGRTFHYVDGILPFSFGGADLPVDDIAAVCLLIYFGISTLIEATSSDGSRSKEEQEEAELAVSELSRNGAGIMASANTAISTFLLVFVAEWGDKSFFSTIALAAASSPLGVIGGALAAHGVATLLAVVGGSLLGTFLSEKVIAYVGGSLFLIFAAVTLIDILST